MLEKIGGWLQLSEKSVYENDWIRVTHDEVERPNQTRGIYGVVHFKNQAVGIIPIDGKGNTWLVRQSRYTLNQYTWEIPEGGSPEGEDPLESAKRELKEEVGIEAAEWESLMTMHTSNSVTDEIAFIYVARGLTMGEQALDDTEDIEVRKLPLDEAIDMVFRGVITDGLSICGLLKLAAMR